MTSVPEAIRGWQAQYGIGDDEAATSLGLTSQLMYVYRGRDGTPSLATVFRLAIAARIAGLAPYSPLSPDALADAQRYRWMTRADKAAHDQKIDAEMREASLPHD